VVCHNKKEQLRPMIKRRTLNAMSTVQEIQEAVSQLAREDLESFRLWFAEFDATLWDRQFEADVSAGRLDQLAEEALKDLREGRGSDL
jgi:hypothetical protein